MKEVATYLAIGCRPPVPCGSCLIPLLFCTRAPREARSWGWARGSSLLASWVLLFFIFKVLCALKVFHLQYAEEAGAVHTPVGGWVGGCFSESACDDTGTINQMKWSLCFQQHSPVLDPFGGVKQMHVVMLIRSCLSMSSSTLTQ